MQTNKQPNIFLTSSQLLPIIQLFGTFPLQTIQTAINLINYTT